MEPIPTSKYLAFFSFFSLHILYKNKTSGSVGWVGEVHRDPYGVMSKPKKNEEKSYLNVYRQAHVSKATV